MKYDFVTIRTNKQLNKMGELKNALEQIFMDNDDSEDIHTYPIVYQFNKGKDGETMKHDMGDEVGYAQNVRFLGNGDLVADITIHDFVRKGCNFKGTIDNFVISKVIIENKDPLYLLEHFIVYDNITREEREFSKKRNESVKKMYNAPKEAYTGNPNAGGSIIKMKKDAESIMEDISKDVSTLQMIRKE